jgi:putative NIF3 family GTP cyclohydrolase 1 type 2
MTAQDVQNHLKSFDEGWVNWDKSVDTFKAGDPGTEVRGIAVGWKAHMDALKKAHDLGCNMFVCHEPLFYDHFDQEDRWFSYESATAKRDWIAEHGMVVVRCHDVWDGVQKIGITDSWADTLGFTSPLAESERFLKVYCVAGRTAGDVAGQVLAGVKTLGSEWVGLIGDSDQPVSRCAVGVGAGTPVEQFVTNLKADICVVTDDGYTFWREGAFAIDAKIPLIVVNHCVAEDEGIRRLGESLQGEYQNVPVHFIPQARTMQLVK